MNESTGIGREPSQRDGPDLSISKGTGFGIGLMAGSTMTALMVALRFTLDVPSFAEVVGEWLLMLTPGPVFSDMLDRFGVSGKPLFYGGVLVGQVFAGGGFGVLYVRNLGRIPLRTRPWERGLLIGVVLWLIVVLVLTPLMEGGFLGGSVLGGQTRYLASTLLSVGAFGVCLTNLHHMVYVHAQGALDPGRREFVQRAAFLMLMVVAGGFVLRTLALHIWKLTPSRVFPNPGTLSPEITANDRFYEVSKNIINPRVDVTSWKLEISGDVGNPYSLTYDELLALPYKEEYVTLTCISNPIGGDLIGNALWRGVPLKQLMERAELPASTRRLAFHAADGYVDSFPVERALQDDVMVVYLMNGEPLPDGHGFPARVIIPGLYGMENVKWLTEIEPVPSEFRGYWQQRGWADTAVINTMSRIDVPNVRLTLAVEGVEVGGVAFAGDRGIESVEISTDEGVTWQPAGLSDPLSPYTWVLWSTIWEPAGPDRYSITVRATDGDGLVQTAEMRPNLPNGATGHDEISVRVG